MRLLHNRALDKRKSGVLTGVLACALAALLCSPLRADDIEIYRSNPVNPNLMLILDNSTSMERPIENSSYDIIVPLPYPYDTSRTYTPVSFASGFYYWTADGSIPTDPTTPRKVAIANFQCDRGKTDLDRVASRTGDNNDLDSGIYTDRTVAWNPTAKRWLNLPAYDSNDTRDVECFTDSGVHGNGGASLYAVNGTAGPWGAMGNEISWANARNYTFYSANYLNYKLNTPLSTVPSPLAEFVDGRIVYLPVLPATVTKYEAMVNVVRELILRTSKVNMGLMWFGEQSSTIGGGYVAKEMVDIDVYANREALLEQVTHDFFYGDHSPSATNRIGSTPLTETLYEAYRYYSGAMPHWGRGWGHYMNHRSVDASRQSPAGPYQSPITAECQANTILLVTDGEPSHDNDSNSAIEGLPNFATYTGSSTCRSHNISAPDAAGKCLDEFAQYLNHDDLDLRSTLADKQNVQTYAIAFAVDNDLLENTAVLGGGFYSEADNADSLADAFYSVLQSIGGDSSATFTTAATSVSAFNRTQNHDFLYYTLFSYRARPRWDGNLKKYKIVYNANGTAYITDASSTTPKPDVIDADTGNVIDSAKSFWSSVTDGNNLLKGGVRGELTDSHLISRKVWTDVNPNKALNSMDNKVHENTTDITTAMLGISDADVRSNILKWMRGVDLLDQDGDLSSSDSRQNIGDPLHSKPVIVTYGGTQDSPQQIIFVGTNDGYLHAIDEATGKEIFSYIPEEVLGIQQKLYDDIPTSIRPYGLDGSITAWVEDKDGDGKIEPADGDHVYLYFGMRRGGRNYYALDVTKANDASPSARLLWKIVDGNTVRGSAGTSTKGTLNEGLYSLLGQSWSQPVVRTVKIGTTEKTVLVVGGGYDSNQDNASVRTADIVGRALYFINAETGALEWKASSEGGAELTLSAMDYSIPSKVSAYDLTGNGLLDRIYVGDMGGQLWRFDVDNGKSANNLVTGGVIASLAGTAEADARRFYYPPDVAFVKQTSGSFLSILLGSGYRAHPLNRAIEDRLYMIRDSYGSSSRYSAVTESDLYDATANDVGQATGTTRETARNNLASADGWLIKLAAGEKSLSSPLILDGVGIMSTYTPKQNTNACEKADGIGLVYYVNIADATPTYNFDPDVIDSDSNLTVEDRKFELSTSGIPSEAAFLVGEDSNGNLATAILHGKEQSPEATNLGNDLPFKTYWYSN